ncbi:MAG: cadmium resistance transporter [Methanobacterium sp.]|nr:cadmium resistance transporter [Methanobacterium sp.]
MIEPLILVLTAVTMFIATNLDDLFVLMLFFAIKDFDTKQIVLGQYFGVITLILISALSYFLKFFIPMEWIGLLGLAPITIGLKNLKDLRENNNNLPDYSVKNENQSICSKLKNNNSFLVASVTVANGGDNIGVYIPLFASINSYQVLIIILIFLIMIGIWCYISFKLVDNRLLGSRIRKYGHIIFPFVLIFLGLGILAKSFIL